MHAARGKGRELDLFLNHASGEGGGLDVRRGVGLDGPWMNSPAPRQENPDETMDVGVLLSRGFKVLALLTLVWTFAKVLPDDLAVAAGIGLSWTLGVALALAKTRPTPSDAGPVNLGGRMRRWLLAGFFSTVPLCFLWISSYFWLVDPEGLAERMAARPQEVGWREAAVFGGVGALVYGCFGAIVVGVARASVLPVDHRIRGGSGPGRGRNP